MNYTRYLNEETEYITMNKTKGTSIPSVIVVMEEYFWNEYDFSLIYSQTIEGKSKKRNDYDFLKAFPNAGLFKDYTEKGDCI